MREKLIKLIRKADKEDHESRTQDEHYAYMADYLIENGVVISKMETTTKWIPVTERLPEQYETVIGWTYLKEMGEVQYDGKNFVWTDDDGMNDYAHVTHWMPMPEPPKKEEDCICCGAVIPDGQKSCPNCLVTVKQTEVE